MFIIICFINIFFLFSGGPQIRFSIGAGDRQSLQPPLSNTLPTTRTSVIQLFRALGMLTA